MQSYPRNSPEAAARIVALALVTDGNVCQAEIDAVYRLQVERELGLPAGRFADLVRALCEDLYPLQRGGGWTCAGFDRDLVASFVSDVTQPELQHKVMAFVTAAASADHHLADAELQLLEVVRQQWGRAAAHAH